MGIKSDSESEIESRIEIFSKEDEKTETEYWEHQASQYEELTYSKSIMMNDRLQKDLSEYWLLLSAIYSSNRSA